MKKFFAGLSLLALVFVLIACGGGNETAEESSGESTENGDSGESEAVTAPVDFLQIGSGPMGSGWYPLTTIISEIYMDEFDGLNVSQLEGASVANMRSLDSNDVQYAINYANTFIEALNGEGDFDEPIDSIASLASLYPVYQQIATLESNDDINTVEDIVDKHIFLGPQGGGGPVAFWNMMEEYGIDETVIEEAGGQISYGNYSDGASMMKDGIVEVFVGGGSPMIPALQEIDVTNPVKVLPIEDDKLESIKARGLGISSGNLPAGTYGEQDEEVPTYTLVTTLSVRKDLEEDFVYHLTKFLWENHDKFEEQLPTRAADMTLDTVLDGLDKESMHSGALKYYEEVGAVE